MALLFPSAMLVGACEVLRDASRAGTEKAMENTGNLPTVSVGCVSARMPRAWSMSPTYWFDQCVGEQRIACPTGSNVSSRKRKHRSTIVKRTSAHWLREFRT